MSAVAVQITHVNVVNPPPVNPNWHGAPSHHTAPLHVRRQPALCVLRCDSAGLGQAGMETGQAWQCAHATSTCPTFSAGQAACITRIGGCSTRRCQYLETRLKSRTSGVPGVGVFSISVTARVRVTARMGHSVRTTWAPAAEVQRGLIQASRPVHAIGDGMHCGTMPPWTLAPARAERMAARWCMLPS